MDGHYKWYLTIGQIYISLPYLIENNIVNNMNNLF